MLQLDGNDSVCSSDEFTNLPTLNRNTVTLSLPIIATYNMRSLLPKVNALKTDLLERNIDIAFLQEIWEDTENHSYRDEMEKMFQLNGLLYLSTPRPKNGGKAAYGGAAFIINTSKYSYHPVNVQVPKDLEIIWGSVKPLSHNPKFRKIIICSFYSPPSSSAIKNAKLSDHITSTLHLLSTENPNCGIFLGADVNSMNFSSILNCGLRLRQIVDKNTRGNKILDIIFTNLSGYYKSPIIAPPISCDDPRRGVPSDHSVPICIPHSDRHTRPERSYKTITFRPLPETKIRAFGEWIVKEDWNSMNMNHPQSVTQSAQDLEKYLLDQLNLHCPQKTLKLSNRDKSFITIELKQLDRKRNREYIKRGKSMKYYELKKKFETLYKSEASKYLHKNVETLIQSKPGQAYKILKRLGAQPGDSVDSSSFTLPDHENLSAAESAERIAAHFSSISNTFLPLSVSSLSSQVQEKLQSPGRAPKLSEYDVYVKIKKAKKPRSGTRYDIPKELINEFSPELAKPLTKIFNSMFQNAEWPTHWKHEFVVPIPKVTNPECENDLRPISLTPFFSKVAENFVVDWLLCFIGDKIDFRQYGGLKGNSISHYIIEFMNFVLASQDSEDQTAVLACFIDFQKAFMRQNHNILIEKLSLLGVPGWLLQIVISFLQNRTMSVRYRGFESTTKSLPGGGPQGTLIALLLFIVLVNDLGFDEQINNIGDTATSKKKIKMANEIHLKFIDDLTIAESIKLKQDLVHNDNLGPKPVNFHSRTGHSLPVSNSKVHSQLQSTLTYAKDHEMKINFDKTKLMLFNTCTSVDFMPTFVLDGKELEVVAETRLLGLQITSDMKWKANTGCMISKANKRLWILRRLKILGADPTSLVDVYIKQVRSVLEFGVPVWQGSLTVSEKEDIEKVQRNATRIILGRSYKSYETALQSLNLEYLDLRRTKLCLNFALKAEADPKFCHWFKKTTRVYNTRGNLPKYKEIYANHSRYLHSSIGYLTKLLNQYHNKHKS